VTIKISKTASFVNNECTKTKLQKIFTSHYNKKLIDIIRKWISVIELNKPILFCWSYYLKELPRK